MIPSIGNLLGNPTIGNPESWTTPVVLVRDTAGMAVNFFEHALSSIAFGPEIQFENLTMLPLLADARRASEPLGRTQYLVLVHASGFTM